MRWGAGEVDRLQLLTMWAGVNRHLWLSLAVPAKDQHSNGWQSKLSSTVANLNRFHHGWVVRQR